MDFKNKTRVDSITKEIVESYDNFDEDNRLKSAYGILEEEYEDNVADLIILNGPLYHLTDKKDRLQVLKEAKRILKSTGRLLGFTISRFAGLNYALSF